MGKNRRSRGFSLIEAMIAVIVLSLGLLALAALQTRLMRASADGKMQSAALALAKAEIERQRSYRDATAWRSTIVDSAWSTVNAVVGGQNFAFERQTTVDRFQWSATATPPAFQPVADDAQMTGLADFKRIRVDVRWLNESNEQRQVTLSDVISSVMPSDSARLVANPTSNRRQPQVRIFAPNAEGIIPIAIGDGQSSASSNPKPVQFDNDGGATLTRFNVQTYMADSSTPLLQRRLEFSYVSCQCRLNATTSTVTSPAYEPSYWNGERYTAPRQIVGRQVSLAIDQINDQQDVNRFDDLCTSCCRDHQDDANSVTEHDTGGADSDPATARRYKVDPFRPLSEYANGKHVHYTNTSPTTFTSAPVVPVSSANSVYFETCRLARVDGINRVTVDSRLENLASLNLSPEQRSIADNALATLPSSLTSSYAAFAKRYVELALGLNPDTTPPDTTLNLPGTYPVGGLADQVIAAPAVPPAPATYTQLAQQYDAAFLDLAEDDVVQLPMDRYHNLSARGIYIDFLSTEARNAIACVGSSARNCAQFRDKNPLELVPFFAVNLTNLAYFRKTQDNGVLQLEPNGFPQTYGQDFVRGRVRSTGAGDSKILASSRRGNAGLTDQIPIYPDAGQIVDEGEPFRVQGNNSGNHRALVQWTCADCRNNDAFYTKMGQKQLNATPDGTACAFQADSSVRECSTGTNAGVNAVDLRFASYVIASCSNNYVYDPGRNLCVRTMNNGTQLTENPTIADYQFCRLTALPAGATGTVIGIAASGVPAETTTVRIAGTGLPTLLDATLPASPIQAVFARGSCP
ncbi:MAG TPA: prepilin-type N-terminal cleavage/methylation domain-containing protein [Xanthomonadales bacterium]|nr:prepilin-type N-terminal cleavage/methylation domain-containing protein [Xanthomonadales bacterium]